jgi:hypothetical protein
MAIAKFPSDDEHRHTNKVEQPAIEPPSYSSTLTDARYKPLRTLVANMAGRSWLVEYYRQLLGKDEEPIAQQVGDLAPYQQYQRIRNFELRVQTPLTRNLIPNQGETEISGEAYMLPCGFAPNVGDMFITDVGDGNLGVFVIRGTPEPMSMFKDTAYRIEYMMTSYLSRSLRDDLIKKTIVDSVYDLQSLQYGRNPIIGKDEYNRRESLSEARESMVFHYMDNFYYYPEQTLAVPNQAFPTYDPFLVSFVYQAIDYSIKTHGRPISQLNTGDYRNFGRNNDATLWDAVMRRDARVLRYALRSMGIAGRKSYQSSGLFNSIANSKFENVVRQASRDYVFVFADILTGVNELHTDVGTPYSLSPGDVLSTMVPRGYAPQAIPGYRIRYYEKVVHNDKVKMKVVYEAIDPTTLDPEIESFDDLLQPIKLNPAPTAVIPGVNPPPVVTTPVDGNLYDDLYQPMYMIVDGGDTRLLFPATLSVKDYYVLTAAFYNGQLSEMSILEAQVWDLIHNRPLDHDKVQMLLARYYDLTATAQFYYGPLLITLAEAASYQNNAVMP